MIKLSALWLSSLILAVDGTPPVWEQHPTLTCALQAAVVCDITLTDCQRDMASAILRFDFSASKVKSLSSPFDWPIEGRYHFAGSPDSVLSEGRMFTFSKRRSPAGMPEDNVYEGFELAPILGDRFSAIRMVCRPG
jgi:hypothetical protein